MQQNVHSEYKNINHNYSQQRNSIPSKCQQSQIINHQNNQQNEHNQLDSIQIDGKHYKASPQTIQRLKLIQQQIRKQKQMISRLKKQNEQQIQNILQKSYFSLNKHQFTNNIQNDNSSQINDSLLQTKTQINDQILQNRKNNAKKELQSQEDKYRQNIRKIQLKRSQIKKRLNEDKEIPIKIMDLKQFELKKNRKDTQQNIIVNNENKDNRDSKISSKNEQKQNIQKDQIINESGNNILNQIQLKQQESNQILQKQQSNQIHQASLNPNQSVQNKSKVIQPHISIVDSQSKSKVQQNNSKLLSHEQNSQKYKQRKLQNQVNDSKKDVIQNNNSRISQNNSRVSSKKYSVKKSSVIVPQSNDSIKEIQERRSKKGESAKKQLYESFDLSKVKQKNQHQKSIKKQQLICDKSDNSILNDAQENISAKKSQKDSYHEINLQKTFSQSVKNPSQKESIMNKQYQQKQQQKPQNQPQKSVKSKNSNKTSSKKQQQKIQLMYIPHAPKSPSHKSFKKTDKSIQWSQVDLSMFGKSNETHNNQSNSNLLNQINQKNDILQQQASNFQRQSNISANKINMKKGKNNEKVFFEEVSQSQKAKASQKSINLAPIQTSNKQKSQKSSLTNKSNQNNRGSIIASREGSVKQKVDKYDKFHRQHSLNNKKLQNKKQELLQQIKKSGPNKAPSYRSRKSNPISSSSKGKPKTVSGGQKQLDNKKQQVQKHNNQKSDIDMQTSRILISKQEIQFLHRQIRELQEKLQSIQKKQESLMKEKAEEELKLQQERSKQENKRQQNEVNQEVNMQGENQIVAKQEQKSQKSNKNQNKENLQENKANEINTPPITDHQPKLNQSEQQKKQQTPIQQSHLANLNQISNQFNQQKQSLLQQVSRLRKIIRDLQIQKIKSIDNDQTVFSTKNQHEQKKMQTQSNEVGVIIHQNMKQTLDANNSRIQMNSISQDNRQKSKSPFGKIIKNVGPQSNNNSRITQNLQSKHKSNQKHFRISASKKASINSDIVGGKNQFGRTFDSFQLNSIKKGNKNLDDEQKNDLLGKKKNGFYPINQKEGYVVANAQFGTPKGSKNLQQNNPISSDPKKIPKSQLTKQQVLQKFHRTNRQFHNFIQSSRVINQTNSSMSSQNNFFFNALNQTNQSNDFLIKRNSDKNDDYYNNPQNGTNILTKMSSSNLQMNQQLPTPNYNNKFQQSFTRIIDQIKNDNDNDQNQQNQIPEIQIRDIQNPQLPKTPDITYDQDQLMELAKQTFRIFDIQVKSDDQDFNMKKYKNCVIFTKGSDTILWHYNGKFYLGGWKNKQNGQGQKTGYGIQIVPDKHIYKGQFMNGKKHGTGILKLINGNIYDGQWIQGIKNGQGTYYEVTTKVAYQGQWKDGKKNGFGLLKFSQKQYYQGTFLKSVKQGYGTQVFVNGDKYKGQYRKGKFHGKGKYSWANGSVYEGDFFQGMRNGNGTWKSAKINFDIYVGSYKNDKKCGYGRYVWSNGCIYQGNFAQDVKHGKGKLIYTDGKQIKGVWEQGSLLQAVTQNPKQKHQQQRLRKTSKLLGMGSKIK